MKTFFTNKYLPKIFVHKKHDFILFTIKNVHEITFFYDKKGIIHNQYSSNTVKCQGFSL